MVGEFECGVAGLKLFIELSDADGFEDLPDLGAGFKTGSEEIGAVDEVWGIKLCGGCVGKEVPGETGVVRCASGGNIEGGGDSEQERCVGVCEECFADVERFGGELVEQGEGIEEPGDGIDFVVGHFEATAELLCGCEALAGLRWGLMEWQQENSECGFEVDRFEVLEGADCELEGRGVIEAGGEFRENFRKELRVFEELECSSA